MEKYKVLLSPNAYTDLDNIYKYIKIQFKNSLTALEMVELIEETILKLDTLPHRGAERKIGIYANQGYRQLFVKNYTIVYRIDEELKQVIIITIKYSASNW